MKSLPLLLFLVFVGCGPTYPVIPGQDLAMPIVWNQVYQRTTPTWQVEWIMHERLNCNLKDGAFSGFYPSLYLDGASIEGAPCVAGETFTEWRTIQVAHPDDFSWRWMAFPHELFHAFLFETTGDADASHKNPGFWAGAGAVYQAMDALAKVFD